MDRSRAPPQDPYLGYVLARSAVRAIQAEGVLANAKHWVVNSQETARTTVDEIVDERTRMQYYYPPFMGAIEGGVGSVMCSCQSVSGRASRPLPPAFPAAALLLVAHRPLIAAFHARADNKINGFWSCENNGTLRTDLKLRLNFTGWGERGHNISY
jgi:beta-glucosidase-like glycosyl hydrolase